MSREPLSNDEINNALSDLDGWRFQDDRLLKTYEFGSFREAVGFIVRISFEAEELNHHPELSNVYNRVDVGLSTHDAGNKVTQMDVDLATRIERISWV